MFLYYARTLLDAEMSMVWAPEDVIVAMTPPPKDPALLMKYNGGYFVVHTWACAEERPIDAFLKEFETRLEDTMKIERGDNTDEDY